MKNMFDIKHFFVDLCTPDFCLFELFIFALKSKTMKKSVYFAFIILCLVATIQFNACKEDDPNNPEPDAREKFLGTWSAEESCVRLIFEVDITADENDKQKVWLNNFADTPPDMQQAYGIVSGYQINIPEQTIGDGWIINGIGTLQPTGKIVWAYYIEIGAEGSNCEAEFEK